MNDRNRRHHPGRGPWSEWTDQPGEPWGQPWGQWGQQWAGRRGRGPGGPGAPGGPGGHGGPPPWAAALFGFAQPEQRRGPRVRRGDVRSAILDVMAQAKTAGQHINGYQVIQQIAERSKGAWRPSPGSVYPTIAQLEDEGLLETDEGGGRRAVRLTADGDAYVAAHADELAAVWRPFDDEPTVPRGAAGVSGGEGRGDFKGTLKSEIGQVAGAVWQLATQGSEAQRQAALDVLVETRRRLYGILADGPEGAAPAGRRTDAGEADPSDAAPGEIDADEIEPDGEDRP